DAADCGEDAADCGRDAVDCDNYVITFGDCVATLGDWVDTFEGDHVKGTGAGAGVEEYLRVEDEQGISAKGNEFSLKTT
ncbi:hypothetical protein U1Q18_008052, partial [Sarracenia purpurea var. burkii]